MVNAASSNDTEQITVSRAARLLELSENRIRQLADRGQLRCHRIGTIRVFNRADVEALRAARGAA